MNVDKKALKKMQTKKRIRSRMADLLIALATGVVILVLWHFATVLFNIPKFILPSPVAVIQALFKYWPLSISSNLLYTLSSIGIGFGVTVVISIPLAVMISSIPALEKTVYPLFVVIQLIPKVALAPLFIVWFGFGITSKIVMVFLMSFFPLLVNATTGFKSLNPRLVYVARTMTDSQWKFFWAMRFPSALPDIFTGLKIAVSNATVGAIIGEFVGSNLGLGYLMLKANGDLNTAYMMASLLILAVVGILLYKTVEAIEAFALPWHVSRRKSLIKNNSTL